MSCIEQTSPPNDAVSVLERIHESILFQNVVLRTLSNTLNEFQLKFVRHISAESEKEKVLSESLDKFRLSMQSFIDIANQYKTANCLKTKHYFVVPIGHNPGIYSSYEDAVSQVENFPDGFFKAFEFLHHAENYMQRFNEAYPPNKPLDKIDNPLQETKQE